MIKKYGTISHERYDKLDNLIDWQLKSFKEYTKQYKGDLIARNIERKCKFPFARLSEKDYF